MCVCVGGGGSWEDNIWICFSWCAVVAATAQRGQAVGFIFSRYTASPPRGSDRLVPGPSRPQNFQPCCSRWRINKQFFFLLLAPAHILRTATVFFYFGGQRGAAVLRKWRGIFRTQNTTGLRNRAERKKTYNRHIQVSSESEQSRCNLPSWRGWMAGYLAGYQCFCIIKPLPLR